jgi:hypothetical protein
VDSTIGFQVTFLRGLAPIDIPKKRNGIESTPQCRKVEAAAMKCASKLMPKRLILKKLTFKPDINLKLRIIVLKDQRLSQLPSPTIIVSFVN